MGGRRQGRRRRAEGKGKTKGKGTGHPHRRSNESTACQSGPGISKEMISNAGLAEYIIP